MRSIRAGRLQALAPVPRRLLTTTSSRAAESTSSAVQATPITSLLIANRGEIALRVNRTAHRMGIFTTTLYTDLDASSQHAACGSQSLALGASNAYLDGERIISLVKKHGIQALHPGYGFLSENAAFAARCEKEGIIFVGPPAQAMADMGDKARSKEIMTAAGVPCVPGYHGPEQSEEQLLAHARNIRFPVLLKSVRGGGGKGMRIVMEESEFPAQLRSARAEARASFGEGGEVMLVEKYITRPRHVEVQVFADKHGNCVALGERDCSVQRRHQKIVEESPAPLLDEKTRQDLWEKARTAASAVGYVGAGTVEFIFDKDTSEFFFMEMNTRLQVEHPVSEMVTGTDLVEWQFRVAAGERLPLTQDEISERIHERGAAIEARIYAESPEKGFIPDSGKLLHLRTPATDVDPDVRIDAGFAQGDTVSEAYDGMIAKLIVRGPDRETAIRKMELALRDYEVVGLSTNIEFLKRLCRSKAFIDGDVETGFVKMWEADLMTPPAPTDEVFVQAALAVLGNEEISSGPHGQALGFGTSVGSRERKISLRAISPSGNDKDEQVVTVSLSQTGHALFTAEIASPSSPTPTIYSNLITERTSHLSTTKESELTTFFPHERINSTVIQHSGPNDEALITVFQGGAKTELKVEQPSWFEKALGKKEDAGSVAAPMPCKVLRNEVSVGETVEKGQALVVIESMKMETVIRAPRGGVVKRLAHKEGDICKAGTVLVVFEEEGENEA